MPTYAEQCYEDIVFDEWFGIHAPTKTPPELAVLLRRDTERWEPLVKAIGFTAGS